MIKTIKGITQWMVKHSDRLHLNQTCILLMLAMTAVSMMTSCEEQQQTGQQEIEADSLINEAYKMRDYERLLTLAELHESRGALSEMKLCYWRGYAYSRLRKMRLAEMEWKKAMTLSIENDEDLEYYAKTANRLAGLLYLKSNFESTIRTATTAMNLLKEKKYTLNADYANLQTFMGCCQLKLGRINEANTNFSEAWQYYLTATENSDDIVHYTTSIVGIINITDAYIQTQHFQEGFNWTERFDSMLTRYKQQPQADDVFIDKQWARLHFYRACALEGLNRKAEAEKAYTIALSTHYAKTGDGQIESTSYLIKAERWNEAADMFKSLNSQMYRYDIQRTLDNIQLYLQPKYIANVHAHRTDSAISVGLDICESLDTAITLERQNSAIELSTIYETQEKETELVEQKATLSQQRYLTIVITLLLVIIGFGLFVYFRHQAAKRLEIAYHELEKANARAEESSRMKSAFIQQISHEIRTPLNILSGFTQVITSPGMEIDDSVRADINQQITENTDRITGLVNKMLELSDAKSQSEIEQNDHIMVEEIAAEAVEASNVTLAQHLTFDMQISPDAQNITLLTNHQSAVRALSLLLDNARKFTAPAEASHKEKGMSIKKQLVTLRVSRISEHEVAFCVEDSGIGVPTEEAERIFDEFVQLDEYYDGTGIGLTVARSIARRLGGDIILDTTYMNGARFVFTLPYTA